MILVCLNGIESSDETGTNGVVSAGAAFADRLGGQELAHGASDRPNDRTGKAIKNMQAASMEEVVEQIVLKDPRYQREAYLFLRDALSHTRRMLGREAKTEKPVKRVAIQEKHVTGQELLEGIRELALETYGPMTITVFEEWGIHSCKDFGEMVFIMVESQLLKKTEKDSRADFENGYDFIEAFRNPFLPQAKLAASLKAHGVAKA
jgi:uncharacterized repeat protein (TIGR04138 family)